MPDFNELPSTAQQTSSAAAQQRPQGISGATTEQVSLKTTFDILSGTLQKLTEAREIAEQKYDALFGARVLGGDGQKQPEKVQPTYVHAFLLEIKQEVEKLHNIISSL